MKDPEADRTPPPPSAGPAATRSLLAPVASALVASVGAAGCGGGLPLLHPARTLPSGEIRAAAGFSGNVAVAGFGDALRNATNEAASGASGVGATGDANYAKGALVAASIGPGLAPFAAARAGLGEAFEGGLAYTGRAVRADVRRAFDLSPRWALSIGVGGSAALYGREDGSTLPNVDLSRLHGWGADVPLLLGYESDGDLYMLWAGARTGWEHVDISDVTSEPQSVPLGTPPVSLSATRFWAGGVVGLAVGFRHVHVAIELDVSYANLQGDYNQTHAEVSGLTLAPATALWWDF